MPDLRPVQNGSVDVAPSPSSPVANTGGAIVAAGRWGEDGTLINSKNCSLVRDESGVYTLTLDSSIVDDNEKFNVHAMNQSPSSPGARGDITVTDSGTPGEFTIRGYAIDFEADPNAWVAGDKPLAITVVKIAT